MGSWKLSVLEIPLDTVDCFIATCTKLREPILHAAMMLCELIRVQQPFWLAAVLMPLCVGIIEGLHNVARTYMRMILTHHLVSLFVWCGVEKNNKKRLNFWFTLWKELKFQPSVCADIFVTLL